MALAYLFLSIAIISEIIGTMALKSSDGFKRFWPSLIVISGYGLATYMLSLVLRTIPIGIAYAIWAGIGIALISIVSIFLFDQKLDLPAVVGIGLIIAGVATINLFSKVSVH